MPEIFNDEALAQLQEQARLVSVAVGEFMEYKNYGERFSPSEKAKLIADIKSSAAKGGIDLTDWLGNRGVDAPGGGPP